MKISDKELDELFSSKLDGLEAEPSANLWQNISFELDKKPRKKSFVPALRIAAGLIVVLSVGLLFLQKNEPVKNQLSKKLVKVELAKKDPSIEQIENLGDKKSMLLLSAKIKAVKEVRAIKKPGRVSNPKLVSNLKLETSYPSTQTLAQNKTETNQQQETTNANIAQTKMAVVPDMATKLTMQPENETPEAPVNKPQILPAKRSIPATIGKRKGIRSMGDLVNLVMAKVDKRNDKLIEFSDNDDGDESNITGINLGIITIKKEK